MLARWRAQILDPKMCWDELRSLASPADAKQLAATRFGHWALEGQLRAFLGAEDTVAAPPEAHVQLPPVRFGPVAAPAVRKQIPAPADPSQNALLQILLDPVKLPFPNYTGNASYQYIERYLKVNNVLDMDLRAANADLSVS